jgi:hypothetical protein
MSYSNFNAPMGMPMPFAPRSPSPRILSPSVNTITWNGYEIEWNDLNTA